MWGLLTSIKSIGGEPVCLWLPTAYITQGTSEYVQGVEVSANYDGVVPDGFDVIEMQWDSANPRIQLEPIGTRGYIELLAVK